LGYTSRQIFEKLTYKEYIEGYLFAQYREWESILKQQVAVAAGIQTGAFGKPRLTMEDLFFGTQSDTTTFEYQGLRLLENFPYDTPMLPHKSVVDLLNYSKKKKTNLWDDVRGKAALNEGDRLLSRVAQDDYLWKKWTYALETSSARPSVDIVRQWAENEANSRLLHPPGYYIDMCVRKGKDPQKEWTRALGPSGQAIQEQLFSGMLHA